MHLYGLSQRQHDPWNILSRLIEFIVNFISTQQKYKYHNMLQKTMSSCFNIRHKELWHALS